MTTTIPSTLEVLSQVSWPRGTAPEPVPGFILSSFNPLIAAVAAHCLARRPAEPARRTGLVLASASGDAVSARELADAVSTGRRVAPLLFFQSNPNAVLGHVASRHGLDGPIVCLGPVPARPTRERALAEAELLLLDGGAEEVLVLLVEQDSDSSADTAEALLVRHFPGKEAP